MPVAETNAAHQHRSPGISDPCKTGRRLLLPIVGVSDMWPTELSTRKRGSEEARDEVFGEFSAIRKSAQTGFWEITL